jgi:hypothetical protein
MPGRNENKTYAKQAAKLKFDVAQLKKSHTLYIRSTAKYREQVVAYCKRFK